MAEVATITWSIMWPGRQIGLKFWHSI